MKDSMDILQEILVDSQSFDEFVKEGYEEAWDYFESWTGETPYKEAVIEMMQEFWDDYCYRYQQDAIGDYTPREKFPDDVSKIPL